MLIRLLRSTRAGYFILHFSTLLRTSGFGTYYQRGHYTVYFQSSTLPKENQSVGLTHASYVPDTWVPLAAACSMFDSNLGGPEEFDRWVIGALTINPTEVYHTTPDTRLKTPFLL
jgi:hypothetical protein